MYNIFFEKSKKNNHKNFLIQENNVNNSSYPSNSMLKFSFNIDITI